MSNTIGDMSRIFDEAIRLVSEKNVTYQDAWREHGWRGSLGKVLTKSSRLRNMLWRNNTGLLNGEKEHPREVCIDMINHLTFMVMNMDAEREWGHEDVAHVEHVELYSGNSPAPVRVDNWQPGPDHFGAALHEGQQTGVMQNVGDLGVPGDESPSEMELREMPLEEFNEKGRPSPRPRGNRRIKDQSQA